MRISDWSSDVCSSDLVTDAQGQAEYDKNKEEQAGRKEDKVRHILVKDEKTADDLTAKIESKKLSFADAAKKDSIDADSGKNGGELGWGHASNYVSEFAKAVESLQKGQMTTEPGHTQLGWHLSQVAATRPIKCPDMAE